MHVLTMKPSSMTSIATALIAFTALATQTSATAATLPTQSLGGYKWARTGPLVIQIGMNTTSAWDPYITTAAAEWSLADNIDYMQVTGTSNAVGCAPTMGTVQICSGNYGKTGWLGYTSLYLYGANYIMAGTIKLNEYYYSSAKYNTTAWRSMTVCQEMGNVLGLADSDKSTGNTNTGSCMDYTNNPQASTTRLANTDPKASDMTNLNAIYAGVQTAQLSTTMPGATLIGTVYFGDANAAVPEPSSWAMLLVGFGAVGRALRHGRRPAHA